MMGSLRGILLFSEQACLFFSKLLRIPDCLPVHIPGEGIFIKSNIAMLAGCDPSW
jgi:hypothetical protein